MAESEQPPRSLLGVDRPAPLLDKLDEPIRRVQPELHGKRVGEHTFAGKVSLALGRDP